MPKEYFRETIIIIDHEGGYTEIETTEKKYANRALRAGFKEITDSPKALPYRRFKGPENSISIRAQRSYSQEERDAIRNRLHAFSKRENSPVEGDSE